MGSDFLISESVLLLFSFAFHLLDTLSLNIGLRLSFALRVESLVEIIIIIFVFLETNNRICIRIIWSSCVGLVFSDSIEIIDFVLVLGQNWTSVIGVFLIMMRNVFLFQFSTVGKISFVFFFVYSVVNVVFHILVVSFTKFRFIPFSFGLNYIVIVIFRFTCFRVDKIIRRFLWIFVFEEVILFDD